MISWIDMGFIAEVEFPADILAIKNKVPIIVERVNERGLEDKYIVLECMEPFIIDTTEVYTLQEIVSKARELCKILVDDLKEKLPEGSHFCWMADAVIAPWHTPKLVDVKVPHNDTERTKGDIVDLHKGKGITSSARFVCEFSLKDSEMPGGVLYVDDAIHRIDIFKTSCPGKEACRYLMDGTLIKPPSCWTDEEVEAAKDQLFDDKDACDGSQCQYDEVIVNKMNK